MRIQQVNRNGAGTNGNGSISTSPDLSRSGMHAFLAGSSAPTAEVMLDAMKRENEHLRNRLVDTERDYIRVVRMNDIYREELIDLRRRVSRAISLSIIVNWRCSSGCPWTTSSACHRPGNPTPNRRIGGRNRAYPPRPHRVRFSPRAPPTRTASRSPPTGCPSRGPPRAYTDPRSRSPRRPRPRRPPRTRHRPSRSRLTG